MAKERKRAGSDSKSAAERRRERVSSQRNGSTRPTSSANTRRRRVVRTSWWQRYSSALVVGIVLVVAIVIGTFAIIANSSNPNGSGKIGPTDPAILSKVTSLEQSIFTSVGTGGQSNRLSAPAGNPSPLKGPDGKPEVFYYGTEWCPLCASERWAMVVALSRFGTFKSLPLTLSGDASIEPTMPDIATFSFQGAEYSSNYISFAPVELEDRTRKSLSTTTAEQQQILTQNKVEGYPFVAIGNKFVALGGLVDPTPMKGLSQKEIADRLSDPKQDISKSVVGQANYLTAAICVMTNNQPGDVCNSDPIPAIRTVITANTIASSMPFTVSDVNYVEAPNLSRKRTTAVA
jgi:thiol-disulfide isomerase/thioredoxin